MIIKKTEQLQKLCQKWRTLRFITVDTEFIREKTYYPVLCLIQVGGGKGAWLIDALSPDLDLSPFWEILLNKDIIKVFHACRQDLEIFYHLMKKMPTPVFDTQVGAMVCGYNESIGYQQLVRDYLGIKLDKGMRITDWAHRPLSKEQEKYALHDVIELKDVYQKMMADICAHNRLDWIQEEMQHLTNRQLYEMNIPHMMSKMRLPFTQKKQLHLCARVCEWREKYAQKKDRPRKYIITDEAIVEIAALCPKNNQELESLRNISNGFSKSEVGQSLLKAITSASQEEPKDWPLPQKLVLTPSQKNWMEALRLLLNVMCEQQKVAPYLVASNDDLMHYAKGETDVNFMKGWRAQIFGKYVQELQRGELIFAYDPIIKKLTFRSNLTTHVQ